MKADRGVVRAILKCLRDRDGLEETIIDESRAQRSLPRSRFIAVVIHQPRQQSRRHGREETSNQPALRNFELISSSVPTRRRFAGREETRLSSLL